MKIKSYEIKFVGIKKCIIFAQNFKKIILCQLFAMVSIVKFFCDFNTISIVKKFNKKETNIYNLSFSIKILKISEKNHILQKMHNYAIILSEIIKE